MLRQLASQLHFVRHVQTVDTAGVEPLRRLRDESAAADADAEITLGTVGDALRSEQLVGRFHPRIRRRPSTDAAESCDVLQTATRTSGDYVVA